MKSITTYRVLAVLFGFTGAHNFYFRYKRKAVLELAISLLSCGFLVPIAWVLALYDIATVSHENMSALSQEGKTPLQAILLNEAGYASDSVVSLAEDLINAGVDLEILSAERETALHMVARNAGKLTGSACEHIMRLLLNAGANPEATNAQGKTALQIVLRNEGNLQSVVCEKLARELVQSTGQKKANPTMSLTQKIHSFVVGRYKGDSRANALAFDAVTPDSAPLWLLLYNEGGISGSVACELVRLILQAGASPDLVNSKEEHPIQYLAKDPENICSDVSRDIVKYLVEFGADIHIQDNEGNTPLHLAASAGNYTVVESLLSSGAAIVAKNKKEQTPAEVTTSEMVKAILAAYTKNPTPAKA